jgi:copper chaperone NosL
MDIRHVTLSVALLLGASCGVRADGPPEIVVDRTACSHCGMLISEPLYAAAYQAPGAATRVFDDLGCLRNAAREQRGDLRIWVHDAASGEWIDGRMASFVASATIRTPMGGGLLAYRQSEDAERAAVKYRGRIIQSLSSPLHTKEAR